MIRNLDTNPSQPQKIPQKSIPSLLLEQNMLYNLICPITHQIFIDPVVASDGHTYERSAISEWMRISKNMKSPVTGENLGPFLRENHVVRKIVQELGYKRMQEKKDKIEKDQAESDKKIPPPYYTGEWTYDEPDYKLIAKYQKGVIKSGKLTWQQHETYTHNSTIKITNNYTYEGQFDKNLKFSGKGILTNIFGTYSGQFLNGLKHGKGIFRFRNCVLYEGDYKNGKREGLGVLYDKFGALTWRGEISGNLPNGKGQLRNNSYQFVEAVFYNGLNTCIL